jgi:hypothetical protein
MADLTPKITSSSVGFQAENIIDGNDKLPLTGLDKGGEGHSLKILAASAVMRSRKRCARWRQ